MSRVNRTCSAVLTGALLLGVAVATLGCRQENERSEAAAQSSILDPSTKPEQSFERIVEEFSRAVETRGDGVGSGFVIRGEEGRSRLSFENKVTSQLFPPAQSGDIYRGVITVTTRSSYFLQKYSTPDSQRDERSDKPDQGMDQLDAAEDEGMEVFDEQLVTSSDTSSRSETSPGDQSDVVARRVDESVSEYELLYKNGRWVLVTELDPNTERSIANAFDHVLSSQP